MWGQEETYGVISLFLPLRGMVVPLPCQFGVPGKREPVLRNGLHQTGLVGVSAGAFSCLFSSVVGLSPWWVGRPWAGGLGCVRKVAEHEPGSNQ